MNNALGKTSNVSFRIVPALITILLIASLELFSRIFFRLHNPGVIVSLLVTYLAFVISPFRAVVCALIGSIYAIYNLHALGEDSYSWNTIIRGSIWLFDFPLLVLMIHHSKRAIQLEKKHLSDNFQESLDKEKILISLSQQRITQTLIETVPSIMWSAKPNGERDYFNQKWFSYTGLTVEQSVGNSWHDAIYPRDSANFLNEWSSSVNTGKEFEREFRLKRADGEYRWHLARSVPVLNEAGQIERWFGCCMDIHQQKTDFDAEQFAKKVLESTTHAIIGVNREGIIYSWNPGAEKMFGYKSNEVIDQPIHEVVRAFSQERESQVYAIKSAIQGQHISGREVTRLRRDNQPLKLLVSVTTFNPDDKGRQSGVVIYQDITEMRALEATANNRLREIEAVFEAMSDGVAAFNMTGELAFTNAKLLNIFGITSKENLADTRKFFQHFEAYTVDNKLLSHEEWPIVRALRGESLKLCVLRCKRSENQTEWWLAFSAEPVRDDQGIQIMAMVIVRDVTAEIFAQQAINRAEVNAASAVAASKLKSEFVANVSHEIRTPLNGILGMSELLLDTPLTLEQRNFVDNLTRSGNLLLAIVNDILDISKIEAGKMLMESTSFNLEKLVDSIIQSSSFAAKEKGIELIYSTALDGQESFLGDPTRLRQVLGNLLGNAIKFTNSGRVSVLVQSVRQDAGTFLLKFEVRDSGIGMSQEAIARLFQPFTQAEASTNRRFGGTGLGLAISQRIVELMGGHITVKSEVGVGSTFCFELELKAPDVLHKEFVHNSDLQGPKSNSLGISLKILLAEDNIINQLIARSHLEKMGHSVVVVANGREVGEALEHGNFDLILMDCQMPEIDGYEATRNIRKSQGGQQNIPIIAMTANAMEGEKEKCLGAGMNDYIAKPISRERLVNTLGRWDRKVI